MKVEHAIAGCIAGTALCAGFGAGLLWPDSGITAAAALLALIATPLMPSRGSILLIAALATAVTVGPELIDIATAERERIRLTTVLWCAVYWVAAALLVSDARRRDRAAEALDDAFAHAPGAMAVIDRAGIVRYANHAVAALVGGPPEDLAGKPLAHVIGKPLWRRFARDRAALLHGDKQELRFDGAFERDGERELWISCRCRTLTEGDGRPDAFVLHVLDVTREHHGRRALAVSESRFRGIIENTAELTLVIGKGGVVTYANPAARRVFAKPADALVGRKPLALIRPKDRPAFARMLVLSQERPGESLVMDRLELDTPTPTFVQLMLTGLNDTPGIRGSVITGIVITDHVEAKQLLKDSQEKFATIFQSSPDAILIIRDSDSRVIDFNDGFVRLLRHPRDKIVGSTLADLDIWAEPEDRRIVLERLEKQGECLDYEAGLKTCNGDTVRAEISVRHVEIDGELCVLAIGRDVTTRRAAEAALKESEEKFARIFADSPDATVIFRLTDSVILDVNDAFLQASGFRRDELVGHAVPDLPVFVNRGDLADALGRLGEPNSRFEMTLRIKSGEHVPTVISSTVIELGGERCVMCVIRDKRRLYQAELKLQESEERFRGAFENAPIGMLLADTSGTIFQANRFALDMLAYREDELLGKHVSRLVPHDERRGLKETMSRLLGTDDVSRLERRMLCENGLEIWTNFHVVLQRGSDGEALYYIIQIADVTEMKRNQERMERMAFYDTLTDLANRRLFVNRLEHAIQSSIRSGNAAALLYLDLDQFKRVNDTLGHEAGDELLREVARRLLGCVRKADTVARPGGDEFTILLSDIQNPGAASRVAEKILEALRQPMVLFGHQLVVTTSIGITIVPDDSIEPSVLTKNADLAMYRAKERGRNNYQFYAEDMNTDALTRLNTENELHRALARDELRLYFQPKVRISDLSIAGVESLIRWQHPERGLLPPGQFVPVAEDTGVIVPMGNWVIEAACRAARDFGRSCGAPMSVAVNISPRQFRDPNLITTVRKSLRESGVPPSSLELEITETMLMDDVEAAALTVKRLHDLGVRLAIDDFGTGYSSFNYLKRFPIDTVKVDRSFVEDIPDSADNMAITSAVIAMAHRLNMEVVAEGVETPEQLAFLAEHGCELAQGFYFSKPVPFEDALAVMNRGVGDKRPPPPRRQEADGSSVRRS